MKKVYILFFLAVIGTAFLSTLTTYSFLQKSFLEEMAHLQNVPPAKLVNQGRSWSAPDDFIAPSEEVTPAVVNIIAFNYGSRMSGGSGVVISSDGYIVTNHHVVEGANSIEITFNNNRELEARLIGTDPTTDLALLKVEATDLTFARFSNSDEVKVGQWVLAIGNPFNLASTVTAGIVSAKARNINILDGAYAIESFIQTDAVVNPGNSGGALIDTKGELVGINTAIITESGAFEGYSFAIPSNLVLKIVSDLREFGEVRRALLGINIANVTDDLAGNLNLPDVAGVFIRSVTPGSSADKAGLKSGDVIVSLNGSPTASVPELQEQVARFRPGDTVRLGFIREGKLQLRENVRLGGIK